MLSLEEVKNVYRESNQKKKKKSEPKPKPQQRYQPKYDRSSKSTHRTRQPANTKPYVSKGVQEQQKKSYNETSAGRFTQGVYSGLALGLPQAKGTYHDSKDKERKVTESKAYTVGKIAGDLLTYGTGYGAVGKAIAKTTAKAATKTAVKAVGKKAAKEAGEKAVKETAKKSAIKTAKEATEKNVGKSINKVNEKLGEKISKTKVVDKIAEKQAKKEAAKDVGKDLATARTKDQIKKDIGAKAASKVTQNILTASTAGTALDTAHAKAAGMDIGLNEQYLKYMGTNALLNIGMGAGFEAVGAGGKAALGKAKNVKALKKLAESVKGDSHYETRVVNGKEKLVKVKDAGTEPVAKKAVVKRPQNRTAMQNGMPSFKSAKGQNKVSVGKIKQARQYARDNGIDFNAVVDEHGGNRVAAINHLYERSIKKVGKKGTANISNVKEARQYARENNINFDDVVAEHDGNVVAAVNDLKTRGREAASRERDSKSIRELVQNRREDFNAQQKAKARAEEARVQAERVERLRNAKQTRRPVEETEYVRPEIAERTGSTRQRVKPRDTDRAARRSRDPSTVTQRNVTYQKYDSFKQTNRSRINKYARENGIDEETAARTLYMNSMDAKRSAKNVPPREKIAEAAKYGKENDIKFADVLEEHNGNRAEAIDDLYERSVAEKAEPVEKPMANEEKVATNNSSLIKDEILESVEDESKSAWELIDDERDFEAWSDYGSEEGAKHVDDALEWMEKNGLDTEDSVLYDEVLARMYLNEKNAAKAVEPTVTAEPKAEVKKPKETVAEQPKVEQPTAEQPKAEQPKEQNMGEFKSSERPQRPTGDSGEVSDMADTIRNAHFQTKESKELMDDIIADGTLNKRYMGNKQAVSMAEKKVSERGADDVAKTFMNNVDDGFEMTSERVAEAYTCMKHYVETGQYDKVEALAERLVHVESEAGRTLQSARLFRSLSPTGRVDAVVKNVKKLNSINGTDIKVPKELLDNLRNSKTQNEINEANKAISMHVWSKIPANWVEKANAWRYLAMLGNPKTHLRNIVGNVVFYPAKTMRNVLATGMEHALLPKAERTKAIMNYASAKDRALWKLGNDSFNNGMKDMLRGQSKYIESGGVHNLGRRDMDAPIFKSKLLNGLYHLNGKMLDAEDVAFMRPAYNTAYAQFLKAKGLTAQTASNEMLKRAEKYAAEEALNSTYRDFNVIANKLNKVKRYANMKTKDIPSSLDQKVMSDKRLKKAAGIAAEALVPFAKTPANILARGIEYSPVGIAQGITKILKSSTSDEVVEGISNLCAGLTGSSVVALGMYFGREGLATGQLDFTSKEDNYDKMLGAQPYSVNINGKSFTVDTVAPISIPFFVGVEAGSSMRNEGIGKDGITLFSVADKIADPVLNLSMLSSLNNVFNNRFSAGNSISSVARKTAQSYLGQYVPTLGSQLARVNQSEYTTTTATNEDPNIREYQRFINQMKNKVPKLADSNAPKVDNWGEKETNDRWSLKSIWQNTANPFNVKELKGDANTLRIGAGEAPYVDTIEGDDVDSELKSLMDQGAENSVLPSSRPSSYAVKYNGEELRMSPKEFSKMQENTGTESKKKLRELFNSDEYKEAGLEDKQKLIEKVYSNVKLDAKRKFLKSRGYTEADISWNLDLSEKDKEDFGSKSKFLKALKKTGVTVSDFAEMKSEGLRVTELKAAAEMGISLKNYHIASEAKKKYKNGYASTLAELYEKGIIKNLDEAKVYDSDAKKYTFNYAKAMIDAGYTADEIYEKTGDMDAVREEVKKNYGNTVHKDGKVFMSREGLKAYLDSRKDLTDKDRYNLWLVYGGAGNGWWNRNPY